MLVNKGLVSTCEDSQVTVFYQNFKLRTSYVYIYPFTTTSCKKKKIFVFTLIKGQLA